MGNNLFLLGFYFYSENLALFRAAQRSNLSLRGARMYILYGLQGRYGTAAIKARTSDIPRDSP